MRFEGMTVRDIEEAEGTSVNAVEDPALAGDQGGVPVVAFDDRDELRGCDVVCVELRRMPSSFFSYGSNP